MDAKERQDEDRVSDVLDVLGSSDFDEQSTSVTDDDEGSVLAPR